MSRRKLSLIVLALASAALSACASPTAPNNELETCERGGGVLGGSGTRCNAPLSGGVLGGSGT
jgi:hypothetical protein